VLVTGGDSSMRPEYVCYRAKEPIRIDGVLDDPSWTNAPMIDLVVADTGATPRQATQARMLWDDEFLYACFHCHDSDIWGITTERDQPIYDQEVVELFVDADCDGRGYVELEVSPLNAVLDLFMLYRQETKRGLWGWDSLGLQTAVTVDGDPWSRGSADHSWTVEIALPMRDLYTAPNVPPKDGDAWYVNLYRIDRSPVGDEYSAWSPPGRINYHTPSRFGRLLFSEQPV